MDFGTPLYIRRVLTEASNSCTTGYLTPELVRAVAYSLSNWNSREFQWTHSPDRVRIVPDSATAIALVISHYVGENTPVVVMTPTYPKFFQVATAIGRQVIDVPLISQDGRYRIDTERLRETLLAIQPALVILCNPHNPTGRVFQYSELAQLAEAVAGTGSAVLSDEILGGLAYSGHIHIPFARVAEPRDIRTFTICSATKLWNIAGTKCSQLVLPDLNAARQWDANPLLVMASGSASTPGALATVQAYRADNTWRNSVTSYIEANAKAACAALERYNPAIKPFAPDGSFSVWVNVGAILADAVEDSVIVRSILNERVYVEPGAKFGASERGFFRMNVATSSPVLDQAIRRIIKALERSPHWHAQ